MASRVYDERMDVDEYVYFVRIAKQVNVLGLGLGKRKAANKRLRIRARITNGGRTDDAPHKVAVAVNINAFTRRAGIVATVHSPKAVALHYMVTTIGIRARQHPDVERLHHDSDVEGRPFGAAICQTGLRRISLGKIIRELDDRVGVHQFPSMHTTDDQNAATVCSAPGPQMQGIDRPTLN
jgi:hypothetical protein